jgi:predicted dehydrogenase
MDLPDRPVRAGFIGAGNFVSANHLPNAAASPWWEVAAICDIDAANLQRAAACYQPRLVTSSYHELLADPQLEVIFVGTRHDLHEPLIRAAAEAGKDVFVEKPMSKTWEETRAILATIQRTGRRLMVGYNRRFSPAMVEARRRFLEQHRGKPALWVYRAVDDARLWPTWPMDPAIGGGKVMSEGCHFYDLACWFLDDEPVWVQCAGERGDDNVIQIAFANGSLATIISGGRGSVAYPKERLEVFCDSTTLVVDMFLELHLLGYGEETELCFPLARDPYPELPEPDRVTGFRQRVARWQREGITAADRERKSYGGFPTVDKGHRQELDAYAKAIRAGGASPCDVVAGARATAVALLAIASMADSNRPQPISCAAYT